jgi:hypothetical protein
MTDAERKEKIDAETRLIDELEAVDRSQMSEHESLLHSVKIKDAYWRRRMASRTDEQIARGVIAP